MSQFQLQITIEESALNNIIINHVVQQSISYAEQLELTLYKVGQCLLQTGERIT